MRLLTEKPNRLAAPPRGLAASTSLRSAQLLPARRTARKSDARLRLWSRRKAWIGWGELGRRPLDGESLAALEHAPPEHVATAPGAHPGSGNRAP